MKTIKAPSIAEILKEEFLDPHGISSAQLVRDIFVPLSRVQRILRGQRRMDADTSILLGRYFGVNERYFLNLQADIDIRNVKPVIGDALLKIRPVAA